MRREARGLDETDGISTSKMLEDGSSTLFKEAAATTGGVEVSRRLPIEATTIPQQPVPDDAKVAMNEEGPNVASMVFRQQAAPKKDGFKKDGVKKDGVKKGGGVKMDDGVKISHNPILGGAAGTPVATLTKAEVVPAATKPEEIKLVVLHLRHILLSTLTKDVGELVLSRYEKKVDKFCHDAVC